MPGRDHHVRLTGGLEALAEPDGICVSDDVMRQIRGKLECDFRDGGEMELKNIQAPVRVWHWMTISVRRIKVAMASAQPWQAEFAIAHERLSAAAR